MEKENTPFKVISNPSRVTEKEIDKLFGKAEDDTLDLLADKLSVKLGTKMINDYMKKKDEEISCIKNSMQEILTCFKKQIADERNSALKISRSFDKKDAIPIAHIDSSIGHVFTYTHIAECFKIKTNKGDKYSFTKAKKLLEDLKLIDDEHFYSMSLQGTKTSAKRFHFDIFDEIVDRLNEPEKHNIPKSITEEWRGICTMPLENEIKAYVQKILNILNNVQYSEPDII